MNEDLNDVSEYELELRKRVRNAEGGRQQKLNKTLEEWSDDDLVSSIAAGHNYQFLGKVGSFCPITEGSGGGILYRKKEGRYHAVSGTKGFRWLEAETARTLDRERDVDLSYHNGMVQAASDHISEFGDLHWFLD